MRERITQLPENFPSQICVLHEVFLRFFGKVHFNIFYLQRLKQLFQTAHRRERLALSGWRFSVWIMLERFLIKQWGVLMGKLSGWGLCFSAEGGWNTSSYIPPHPAGARNRYSLSLKAPWEEIGQLKIFISTNFLRISFTHKLCKLSCAYRN